MSQVRWTKRGMRSEIQSVDDMEVLLAVSSVLPAVPESELSWAKSKSLRVISMSLGW